MEPVRQQNYEIFPSTKKVRNFFSFVFQKAMSDGSTATLMVQFKNIESRDFCYFLPPINKDI